MDIFDVAIGDVIDGVLNPNVDVGCPNTLFCALNPNELLATWPCSFTKKRKQIKIWQNSFKEQIVVTRGSQEPVIAHLVFNLTSKVDRKWECYT